MRAAAFHDALLRLPLASSGQLTGGRPFIVLSPHPDDESLGTGGLVASACEAGQRAEVVILTDGSGSHAGSKAYPREKLIALRKAEASLAVTKLGLSLDHLTQLDVRDAHAPQTGPLFDAIVDRLRRLVEEAGAASLFVTWGCDPHCDHEAADAMARALRRKVPSLALWSYPIWGWHLAADAIIDEPLPQGYRVDVTRWLPAKHAAIAAHASQMTDLIDDDPAGFRFDERTIAPFQGPYEYFFEVPP